MVLNTSRPRNGDPALSWRTDAEKQHRLGIFYTFAAYLLWGAMPLYFALLAPASPVEIISHRILWSVLVCAVLSVFLGARARRRRGSGRVLEEFFELGLKRWLLLGLAGVLVATNWFVYVLAVTTGHILEAALGYFINPILTVVLGVIFLGERLTRPRWIAVGMSVVAVAVIAVAYGALPWISLVLAVSFGTYGLVKKKVNAGAVTSLTVETIWLAPIAAGVLVFIGSANTFASFGVGHALLLAAAGLVTTIPLLFFGAGARRIPLSLVGLMQNLTPILQFLVAILIFGEHMPLSRWIGFALVWVALIVLTTDMLRGSRTRAPAEVAAV